MKQELTKGYKTMDNKKIFMLFQGLSFFLLLSCGRSPNIPEHLDHPFLFGTEKDLYRTDDLKMILSSEAVSSYSQSEPSKEYEKTLQTKESLYKENQEPNVFSLSELLKVTTAKKGEKVKISSNLDSIYIDPNVPFLNEYEVLDYRVEEPRTKQQKILKTLLGRVKNFKGFPNTDYYILPSFLGNYLILYKLAPPNKIPYEEQPIAKHIGGMLAVPLVGYPIENCQAIKVLGSNNIKETLKFRPLCKGFQLQEYIRLSTRDKQDFNYERKLDLFEKDFFEGRWLHFQTLVKSPVFSVSGDISKPSFQAARVVRFKHSLGKLDVIEENNLKQDDEKRVLFIPVEWRDYEIARDSELLDSSFSERVKNEGEDHRAYLQIKFNELLNNEFASLSEGGKSLKSVVVSKDYISFDIEVTTKGYPAYLMKYTFKRYVENPNYKEKKWFYNDNLLFFPLHSVERKYYENLTDHTRNDENHFKRVVRFNPQSKEIAWYFSKQSSKLPWIRELAWTAENLLNQALSQAGRDSKTKIKISLDKSGEDKDLGDIRWNILNLIISESESNEQFPKGRNIANPFTGEVISATANVWVTRILNEYIGLIRSYIRFHIYPPDYKMKPFSEASMNFIYENMENSENLQCSGLSQEPLGVTPVFHEKIGKLCEEVTDFINKNQERVFSLKNSALKDDDIVNSCAQKMAQEKILHSILKQMLTSMGLTNMISSSFDSENFYTKNEIKDLIQKSSSQGTEEESSIAPKYFSVQEKISAHPSPPQYSSVMEPMLLQYPILSVPGKLDISALRFLYFDKVDLTTGATLDVPSGADSHPEKAQKSILETAMDQGYTEELLKKHKMCGLDSLDPIRCGANDYGITPIETLSNKICEQNNDFLSKRRRYDFAGDPTFTINSKTFVARTQNRWQEYRDNLLAREGKSIRDYSFLNPQDVEEYRQIIEQAKENPEFKPYYLTRRVLFDYLKRLSFAPVKHCIYKLNKDYKAIALENIEKELLIQYTETSEKSSEEFINCQSPIVQKWAEEKWGEGESELITEVGFFGKKRKYLIRPNEKTDHVDELQAFDSFYSRFINSHDKVLEEHDLIAEYYAEWTDYILQGLDFKPYIDKNIPLNRILTYKIDSTEEMTSSAFNHLWDFRSYGMKEYRNFLKSFETNPSKTESSNWFQKSFYYQAFSLKELNELANSIQKHPDLYTEFPFLNETYKEYQESNQNISFENFIKIHPAVLYDTETSLYRFPYEDSENNILSLLHRKYNNFSKCIEDYNQGNVCDQLEEKEAFIKLMLDPKDDLFQRVF